MNIKVSGLGYIRRGWIEHLACAATHNLVSIIKLSRSNIKYSISLSPSYSQNFGDIDLNTINVTFPLGFVGR